nr:hypothetical protein [Tanacetum cinerariifolium]
MAVSACKECFPEEVGQRFWREVMREMYSVLKRVHVDYCSSMANFPNSFPLGHRDHLMALFNQEVGEDVGRIRECRGVTCGLKIVMWRREDCIRELKAVGDCQGVAETIREAADEDRMIATKLNRLCEEMLVICERRRNLVDELRSIRGIVVVQKAVEFVADTIRKDNDQRKLKKSLNHRCMPLLRELAGVADSTNIRDQLSVLFIRQVNDEFEKMCDYRRLSDELTESVRMRDAYIEEFQRLQMYDTSDEVIESIQILKGMQVDDMKKASQLILMIREVQDRVYEKNNFITKLRRRRF